MKRNISILHDVPQFRRCFKWGVVKGLWPEIKTALSTRSFLVSGRRFLFRLAVHESWGGVATLFVNGPGVHGYGCYNSESIAGMILVTE